MSIKPHSDIMRNKCVNRTTWKHEIKEIPTTEAMFVPTNLLNVQFKFPIN